ncbi:hypothetical protein M422DRAFT_247949 [Sphaerobolus stellatus SS14]|nr:hypothetical protein M422DRAFT_247949 [Sphaerobolus stellatus SS14]
MEHRSLERPPTSMHGFSDRVRTFTPCPKTVRVLDRHRVTEEDFNNYQYSNHAGEYEHVNTDRATYTTFGVPSKGHGGEIYNPNLYMSIPPQTPCGYPLLDQPGPSIATEQVQYHKHLDSYVDPVDSKSGPWGTGIYAPSIYAEQEQARQAEARASTTSPSDT